MESPDHGPEALGWIAPRGGGRPGVDDDPGPLRIHAKRWQHGSNATARPCRDPDGEVVVLDGQANGRDQVELAGDLVADWTLPVRARHPVPEQTLRGLPTR